MRSSVQQMLRLMTRRSRSGQSIIIIAFGFIVLIAFVGIATDTAMLFVRYSTLRRAVDAAAVAAAGQIREDTTFAQISAAAQQYIKIHGLDPQSVRVETCETEIYDYIVDHGNVGTAATVLPILIGRQGEELCKKDPAKLVRVLAQVNSPTTFLSILGYRNIILTASSVSQTAVMDVALLIDGSLSEAYVTLANETGSNPNLVSPPDFVSLGIDGYDNAYSSGIPSGPHPRGSIRSECAKPNGSGQPQGNYSYGGCCNDPTTQMIIPAGTNDQAITDWYVNSGLLDPTQNGVINTSHVQSGVADGLYDDLVCKPYKDVKDATRRFLTKIDFVRGDRVMLVTFDASIKPLTNSGIYAAGGSTLPVFTSKQDAIRSLNHYAGIEVNPNGKNRGCITAQADPYFELEAFYETVAPCPDTNTGGAIQSAQSLLTNPAWIRRDAVWISVLLSDGYPNRTPGLNTIGGPSSPNIHQIPNDPTAGVATQSLSLTTRFFTVPLPTSVTDPGFCPWWTFCDLSAGTFPGSPAPYPAAIKPWNDTYCTQNNPEPLWWNSLGTGTTFHENLTSLSRPFCADGHPDSRHFCMDPNTGQINPNNTNLCSTPYDADDFARDRVDFAALTDYTSTIKGNFIAMFAIFFPSGTGNINENILGVKFMRYVADAGDNGIIDNHVQKWYRDHITNPGTYTTDPVPPSYNGADPVYGNSLEDPCAKYDYAELNTNPGNPGGAVSPGYPDGTGYEGIYKTSCGNYYYAGNANAINRAFADIASRLFTRLAR